MITDKVNCRLSKTFLIMTDCLKEAELLLSVKESRFEEAEMYLRDGADPRWFDPDGLNSIDYAQLSGRIDFLKNIIMVNRKKNVSSVLSKIDELKRRVMDIPNFTVTFKWNVHSWMPLVTRFCPYDTWTIYKYDCKVRIDSTTADWSGTRWLRGDVSLYIDLSKEDPMDTFIIVDNNTKERVVLLREMLVFDKLDEEIDSYMKMDLLKGCLDPDSYIISRSRGTFGRLKGEIVHEGIWKAVPFDLNSVRVKFTHYYKKDTNDGYEEEPVYHNKKYSGQFWCSKDFPVQMDMLTPFIDCVTPFPDTSKNILKLLGCFDEGMPVKGNVYIFPTVQLSFEFVNYNDDVKTFNQLVDCPVEKEK